MLRGQILRMIGMMYKLHKNGGAGGEEPPPSREKRWKSVVTVD